MEIKPLYCGPLKDCLWMYKHLIRQRKRNRKLKRLPHERPLTTKVEAQAALSDAQNQVQQAYLYEHRDPIKYMWHMQLVTYGFPPVLRSHKNVL